MRHPLAVDLDQVFAMALNPTEPTSIPPTTLKGAVCVEIPDMGVNMPSNPLFAGCQAYGRLIVTELSLLPDDSFFSSKTFYPLDSSSTMRSSIFFMVNLGFLRN
jgi:hypothetical protein